MCGTDLCNKDFDTAAPKGNFDDDGDDFYGAPPGNYDANVYEQALCKKSILGDGLIVSPSLLLLAFLSPQLGSFI